MFKFTGSTHHLGCKTNHRDILRLSPVQTPEDLRLRLKLSLALEGRRLTIELRIGYSRYVSQMLTRQIPDILDILGILDIDAILRFK